jgi:ABC-type transport system involved in multi-copper enzyme maturation permease subunit
MKAFRKIAAILTLTFRESLARKTFIAFFILSTLLHLFLIFALDVSAIDGAMTMLSVFGSELNAFDKIDFQKIITDIQSGIAFLAFFGGIILSLFATANLIPNMLERGSIELLISKPLPRPVIFLARFVGAQIIVALNVTYLIAGSWLILSLKTGLWHWPYLYSIAMVIATFAMLYALVSLVGVTTRSASVSIMVAYIAILLSTLLVQKDELYAFLTGKVYYYLLEALYQVLPKTSELSLINYALVKGQPVETWTALWTSFLAAAAMLSAAIVIFTKKDF